MTANDDILILCNNVKLLRHTHRLSISDFASRFRVTSDTITQLENGILPPDLDIDFLFDICDEFHIPIPDIFKPLEIV